MTVKKLKDIITARQNEKTLTYTISSELADGGTIQAYLLNNLQEIRPLKSCVWASYEKKE